MPEQTGEDLAGILVVESVDDEITRNRHRTLMKSPRLQKYRFSCCHALDLEGKGDGENILDFLAAHPLTEEGLEHTIRSAIRQAEPDFVLLHTGFVFRRCPETFFAVFRRLRREFPHVRFGYEEGNGLAVDPEAFDRDTETYDMQRIFFERIILGR